MHDWDCRVIEYSAGEDDDGSMVQEPKVDLTWTTPRMPGRHASGPQGRNGATMARIFYDHVTAQCPEYVDGMRSAWILEFAGDIVGEYSTELRAKLAMRGLLSSMASAITDWVQTLPSAESLAEDRVRTLASAAGMTVEEYLAADIEEIDRRRIIVAFPDRSSDE